jgi:hypothetical protein
VELFMIWKMMEEVRMTKMRTGATNLKVICQ